MERFCDKKKYVANLKKQGREKMNLIFSCKKKEKELDFKNHLW